MGSCVLPSCSEVCWVIFYVADLGVLRTHGEVLEHCYGPFTDWFIKVLRFIFITLVMYMVSICTRMQLPTEVKAVRCPWVTGSCEPPDVGSGN